jgi:integrase
MSGRLTVQGIKNVKAAGKYSDGGGLGLILWVKPDGGRFWVQRVTINSRRRDIGLGGYPLVSLAEARTQARANKQAVRQGLDPLAEKRKASASVTFRDAADRYLETKLNGYRNAKHRAQWGATLRTYAYPVLGHLDVNTIEPRDVLRAIQPIWETKTETAKRLRGRIEAVLSWATVAGHRAGDNPARWRGNLSEMLPSPSTVAKAQHYPAIAPGDAPRWFRALQDRAGFGARALEMLALTAGRSGDVRGMLWGEIQVANPDGTLAPMDLEKLESEARVSAKPANLAKRLNGAVWVIPAQRMKRDREHRVPLTLAMAALLLRTPRMSGTDLVFPSGKHTPLTEAALGNVMRRLHAADIKSGGKGFTDAVIGRPAVPHGLRSTFRDWGAERGIDRECMEISLAHLVGNEVERSYRRSDMLERRRAVMQGWAGFLAGREQRGQVVPIKKGAAK